MENMCILMELAITSRGFPRIINIDHWRTDYVHFFADAGKGDM